MLLHKAGFTQSLRTIQCHTPIFTDLELSVGSLFELSSGDTELFGEALVTLWKAG